MTTVKTQVLHVEPLRYDPSLRDRLSEVADVSYRDVHDQDDFRRALAERPWDAVFFRLGLSFGEVEAELVPNLRWLVTPTTGLDHIDNTVLERNRIKLISLKGQTDLLERVPSTAEHTWALLLSLVRRLPAAYNDVRAGHWRREPFLADELDGKTLGILGMGRLGKMVARYGVAFGMSVIFVESSDTQASNAPLGTLRATLDEVLATADVVSIHLPLEPSTRGLLSRDRLSQMKRGAFLVNTARGELIDTKAVIELLASKHLAGAALDVVDDDAVWSAAVPEHHSIRSPMQNGMNLIVTPHIGGYGRTSIFRTREFVVDAFVQKIKNSHH